MDGVRLTMTFIATPSTNMLNPLRQYVDRRSLVDAARCITRLSDPCLTTCRMEMLGHVEAAGCGDDSGIRGCRA